MKKIIVIFSLSFLLFPLKIYSQETDLIDSWIGSYKGIGKTTCKTTTQRGDQIRLNIEKAQNFFSYPCAVDASGCIIKVYLPDDYKDIIKLIITDKKLSYTPTRKYPFDFLLEKTQDEFGEEQIEGHVKTYKIVDGKLTLKCETISIEVYSIK